MDKLENLLLDRMTDHKLGSEALAATICRNINELSDGAFTATKYKNGSLTLVVASSSQAADLQAKLSYLRQRFSERISPQPINRVHIRIQ